MKAYWGKQPLGVARDNPSRGFEGELQVACNADDVSVFCDRWPCSGLTELRGVTFWYDRGGNLVDIRYWSGGARASERFDGPALVALSEDAQAYGEKRRPKTRVRAYHGPAIGKRVEIHPACDLWMRGARFGVVAGVELASGKFLVRMDHPSVRRLVKLDGGLIGRWLE